MEANLKLRKCMRASGITQRVMAIKLNITEKSMCNKIGGKQHFTWNEIKVICEMLNIGNPLDVFD